MITLLFILISSDSINFYVDPVIYRSTVEVVDTVNQQSKKENIYYVEFNCGIPYHELFYEAVDSAISAKAIVIFKLSNINRLDSLIDTLYRQFTIPSFSQAAKEQISFIIQFGLHVPEGQFRYNITITSGKKEGIVERDITITKENYRMSDILMANDILRDTIGAHLRKGDLKVIPHPSHQFSERYANLYVFYEIYSIEPDSNKLNVTYKIQNMEEETIRQITQHIEKNFESQAVNLGLSIQSLQAGEYTFSIEVNDPTTQTTNKKTTSFTIIKKTQEEISYEDQPYYEEIEYFLSSKDYKYFQNLPKKGKRIFLGKFWTMHDYLEIAERFEHADKKFREGDKPGHKTDRGRIYVKYGPPDEIEKTTIEIQESKPYEQWQYYNGIRFILVDILSTGEYTLVWTNDRNEMSQPTLYRYLPKSIKDEIE